MTLRHPFIAGNWKMNLCSSSIEDLIKSILNRYPFRVDVLVAPPYPYLQQVNLLIKGSSLFLGAQDLSQHLSGAYTGDVSAAMLTDVGCSHVIIGHSERRHFHAENHDLLINKIKLAISAGLVPIYCVGESQLERENDQTFSVIKKQLDQVLSGLTLNSSQLIIAYEPIWAIGTGLVATPNQAQDVHAFIRQELSSLFNKSFSDDVRLLYGGSVKPDNIKDLIQQDDIDGALVGGASIKSIDFLDIIEQVNETFFQ